ncbi:helix-turn-helix domain-containing protein [Streptomyces rapamycinicus]|uniref:helix-turn-helix domain-containing protein n=1 Tax=Streptomyces rapamycinicus TaxID=1226757 RepID=UPI001FAA99EE|nr:transposase family protein [Streptomyces rapamycinicus]
MATLIHLRHDLPHSVLGLLFGVVRSTTTRAIAEIRTLLAERGRAAPDRPDVRLRTMADVFAYAQTEGIELRLDATEIQVRRPPAGRGRRRVRAHCPAESSSGNATATGTPPTASRSNTPWLTTNAGNNERAGPTDATTCPTPTAPSPASSPTAPSPPKNRPRPGQTRLTRYHAPTR